MKIIALVSMEGEESYRKGKEYDVDDSIGESFIASGHAIAVEGKTKSAPVVEMAVESKTEVKKAVSGYKKK